MLLNPSPKGPPSSRQTFLNFSRCEERPAASSEDRGAFSRTVNNQLRIQAGYGPTGDVLPAVAVSSPPPSPNSLDSLKMKRGPNLRCIAPNLG